MRKTNTTETQPLHMVMMPEEAWQSVIEKIDTLSDFVIEQTNKSTNDLLTSEDARLILGVSKKTWQTYRDRKEFPYIQYGRKILVKRTDLNDFIEKHCIK